MKDLQWFPPIPERRSSTVAPAAGSLIVAAAVGGLFFVRGHRVVANVVWVAAFALFILGLISPDLRKLILRAAQMLGSAVGYVATLVILWPFYVLVLGTVRMCLAAARVDLLGLRLKSEQPSYWEPAAPEQQRARFHQRLFTVESSRHESHLFAAVIASLAFILLLAGSSELILRAMGFGNPIVYRVDAHVGYYPAPNQDVHRYGGNIHINGFGMRSRNVTAEKPAGTFRILMLGDSTLYGGSYLDQSQIYATRLEELLNQNARMLPDLPHQVELLAMGVNGWGPQHELAYAQEFGLFHADLVMVMGPPNDAYRPRYGIEQMPFFDEGHHPHFAWQEFTQHLKWEYRQRFTAAGKSVETSPDAGEEIAAGVAAWMGIADLAQAQGIHVAFELLPNQQEARDGKPGAWTQRVLDALLPELERRQIPEAFPLQFFQRHLQEGKLYHDGAHLDPEGHRIYAGYLRDRVLLLAPESSKQ